MTAASTPAPVSLATGRKISNMSFFCAVLIACIHVPNPDNLSLTFNRWISGGISSIGVPFFLIASGYFFLNHLERPRWWREAVRKRICTILIPFLLAALWIATPSAQWPRWLVSNTFPLYVIHFMLFYLVPAFCKAFSLPAAPTTSLGMVLCVIAVVPASCFLSSAFKKLFPKTAALVFGGR